MRRVYVGSLRALDWNDLAAVRPVALALRSVIGKHPARANFNVYVTARAAVADGSAVVEDYSA